MIFYSSGEKYLKQTDDDSCGRMANRKTICVYPCNSWAMIKNHQLFWNTQIKIKTAVGADFILNPSLPDILVPQPFILQFLI